jgi:hypothetical protein
MDAQPAFSRKDRLVHVIRDVAKALSNRAGESPAECNRRLVTTTYAILAFQPRDEVEGMLAGQCVIFHELIVDAAHSTLSGEDKAKHRATRNSIVTMDKGFGTALATLERYKKRTEQASSEACEEAIVTETDIADRVLRHQAARPAAQTAPPAGPRPVSFSSPESIAECLANPEALAALAAADPRQFALKMGGAHPDGAYLKAASAQMTEFNRQAQTAGSSPAGSNAGGGNRQARRHPNR